MRIRGRKCQAEGADETKGILPRQMRVHVKRIDEDKCVLLIQPQVTPRRRLDPRNDDWAGKLAYRLGALRAMRAGGKCTAGPNFVDQGIGVSPKAWSWR